MHGNITERRIGWHTVQKLSYSAEHQLQSITVTRLHDRPALKAVGQQETTPPAATTQTTHYRYDALGRRIDKTGSFGTTRFGWDGDLLTLEIRGSKQSEYLYEPDSFIPLAKLESAAHIQRPEHKAIDPKKVASLFKTAQTDSDQKEAPAHASHAQEAIESEASVEAVKEKVKDFSVYYYHCDQIGAPQELTDEQGHIVWAVDYKVWGRTEPLRISATGTDDPDPHDLNRFWPGGPRDLKARSSSTTQALNHVEQNLRFQGQYHDHESGLHYNRFRYYDPQTGRFVHQDPIGLFGGFNSYFSFPNPGIWIDPDGLRRDRLPRSKGKWSDPSKPGESDWHSDKKPVKDVTGGCGIPFKNGRPDFSKWSKGELKFKKGVLDGTDADFDKVYQAIGKQKGISKTAAKKWLSQEGLTPHHLDDRTIQLIPTDLHGNVPHTGSASDMRKRCP